jgi:DNA-binding NarL/FixJ family response regulator
MRAIPGQEGEEARALVDPVRVLVVDDHFVVRKGVCSLLADAEGIVVAGEAGDGEQAVAEARRLRPRVILMDLKLPVLDGVAATRAILGEQPETAVLILTGTNVEDEVLAAVEAGAVGYLAKTSPREDFLAAIRRVALGDAWLPAALTRRLLTRLKPRPAPTPENTPKPLTGREAEVLALIARGWSNRRIGQELSISDVTVRTHVSHILAKLGVGNRVEAALHALRPERAP